MAHREIISLYEEILAAWNRQDADAFAAKFADDGNTIGFDGSQMNGRAEIASTLRKIFGDHKTASYVAKVREVRQLVPGITLLRAVVGMVPPGQSDLNPSVNAVQSVIVVEGNIALLHNTPAAFHGRPELAGQLTRELTEVLRSGKTVVE